MLGALQQIVTFSSQKSYFRVHVCGVIETQKRQANALRPNQKAERVPNSLYPVSFPQNLKDMGRKQNRHTPQEILHYLWSRTEFCIWEIKERTKSKLRKKVGKCLAHSCGISVQILKFNLKD